jgi:hypothetical protein
MNVKSRHTLISLLASGIIVHMTASRCAIADQPACASIATLQFYWYDQAVNEGSFSLQQAASGDISGTYTPGSPPPGETSCTNNFAMSGSAVGNGQFALNGIISGTPSSPNCAEKFTGTATISGPGCAKGSWAWSNSLGDSSTDTIILGNDTGTSEGVLPTGETQSVFLYIVKQVPTTAMYTVNLAPTSYNFQGRAVTESFPEGINNGCLENPGSPLIPAPGENTTYPLVNGPNGNSGTPVNGVTTGYLDQVGLVQAEVNQIRLVGDAPCTIVVQQDLTIDTSTSSGAGSYQYQQNYNYITVGVTSMTTERNGIGVY